MASLGVASCGIHVLPVCHDQALGRLLERYGKNCDSGSRIAQRMLPAIADYDGRQIDDVQASKQRRRLVG